MSRLLTICIFALFAIVCLTDAAPYSKYGRTCKDIGCLNNEICVMVEDPCGPGQTECGKYPTCKPSNSVTCETYACPPGQQCTMGDSGPKCVTPHHQSTTHVKPIHSDGGDSHRPSNGGSLYPSLYPSGTTSKPVYPGAANYPSQGYAGGSVGSGYPGSRGGSGYPGGSVGSGYPGGSVGSGYPGGYQSGSGYPGHSGGYPGQYPNQGYPQGGYPQGGYPQGGYPQGGYGYNNHGQSNYPGYGNQPGGSRYGTSSGTSSSNSGSSFTDQIAEGLKAAAGNYLKNALNKAIQGRR